MDLMTFSFACLRVLLKAPRLILAFVSRILAFSSYFSVFPAKLSAKTSMSSVSSCTRVKLLFFAIVFAMGSLSELDSHMCTLSFSFKQIPRLLRLMDTVLYTGSTYESCGRIDGRFDGL